VQEQPDLVGGRLSARGAVGRQMRLPGLDMIFCLAASAREDWGLRMFRLVTMKRVSTPSSPTSTRAMIRSTQLQLAAPSKNSLKRRSLPSFGVASDRAFVLASKAKT
jgi:hypothetical protein